MGIRAMNGTCVTEHTQPVYQRVRCLMDERHARAGWLTQVVDSAWRQRTTQNVIGQRHTIHTMNSAPGHFSTRWWLPLKSPWSDDTKTAVRSFRPGAFVLLSIAASRSPSS